MGGISSTVNGANTSPGVEVAAIHAAAPDDAPNSVVCVHCNEWRVALDASREHAVELEIELQHTRDAKHALDTHEEEQVRPHCAIGLESTI